MDFPSGVEQIRHRGSIADDFNRCSKVQAQLAREQFRLSEKGFAFMMATFPRPKLGAWAYPQRVDVDEKKVSIRGIYSGQDIVGPPNEAIFFALLRKLGKKHVFTDPDYPGCIMVTGIKLKVFDDAVRSALSELNDEEGSLAAIRIEANGVGERLKMVLSSRRGSRV